MTTAEYNARQREAADRLGRGLVRKAQRWLRKNPPPANWKGTLLEWAETEMPIFNVWGMFRRLLGLK